ncbi:MAG: sugar phosphate isomerase/epimerase family protein [Thermoguttaceae bacterium]
MCFFRRSSFVPFSIPLLIGCLFVALALFLNAQQSVNQLPDCVIDATTSKQTESPANNQANDGNKAKVCWTKRPFFALCMDTADEKKRNVEEEAEMLKELGFDGVAHVGLDQLENRLASCEKYHLKLFQLYFFVDLNAEKPFDDRLADFLPLLEKQQTQLALLITGGKPSDSTRDDRAVEVIQKILSLCKPHSISVLLYPHVNNWLESVEDCVRIARRFNQQGENQQGENQRHADQQIGVMFNLCHWIAIDGDENLAQVLDLARPHLQAVTINGTDTHQMIVDKTGNWLQPLGSGQFPVGTVVRELDRIGFSGPVGLQCYGIPGDTQLHLQQSLKVWKKETEDREQK